MELNQTRPAFGINREAPGMVTEFRSARLPLYRIGYIVRHASRAPPPPETSGGAGPKRVRSIQSL
jgi:hypothetical protein